MTNIFTAIINEGDEVVIPAPFWLSYPEIVKLAGGVRSSLPLHRRMILRLRHSSWQRPVQIKTKAFVLNSPNNPTGMIYTREELEALAKVIVEKDIYVVADEMYEYLIYGEDEHVSIASLGKGDLRPYHYMWWTFQELCHDWMENRVIPVPAKRSQSL